jgi:hypothetical protein
MGSLAKLCQCISEHCDRPAFFDFAYHFTWSISDTSLGTVYDGLVDHAMATVQKHGHYARRTSLYADALSYIRYDMLSSYDWPVLMDDDNWDVIWLIERVLIRQKVAIFPRTQVSRLVNAALAAERDPPDVEPADPELVDGIRELLRTSVELVKAPAAPTKPVPEPEVEEDRESPADAARQADGSGPPDTQQDAGSWAAAPWLWTYVIPHLPAPSLKSLLRCRGRGSR